MILSVSNIAWAPAERLSAYDLLADEGIAGLEIAPGLFFHAADDPFAPDADSARAALSEIEASGLSLVSMQALLFGVHSAALFGEAAECAAFEKAMERAIDLGGRFGIPNLVFGSPRQRRVPKGMDAHEAQDKAIEVFQRLGDRAHAAGTAIAIESNPEAYGTNFLTTLEEAASFVDLVDHPNITLVLDLGAMHMNGAFDTVPMRVPKLVKRLTHVHVSEPHLAPAPDETTDLSQVLGALRTAGYKRAVSIEMKRPEGGLEELGTRIASLKRAAFAGVGS